LDELRKTRSDCYMSHHWLSTIPELNSDDRAEGDHEVGA